MLINEIQTTAFNLTLRLESSKKGTLKVAQMAKHGRSSIT